MFRYLRDTTSTHTFSTFHFRKEAQSYIKPFPFMIALLIKCLEVPKDTSRRCSPENKGCWVTQSEVDEA
jgi:hypothetical protein